MSDTSRTLKISPNNRIYVISGTAGGISASDMYWAGLYFGDWYWGDWYWSGFIGSQPDRTRVVPQDSRVYRIVQEKT